MAKIHEHNSIYSLFRPYVDAGTRRSYRRTVTIGLERVPQDGAIIFAPNHTNALMDALNVLRSRKGATVFGARADLFNNSLIAAIMKFLRILPMVRERDGLRNVLDNVETISTICEVLDDGTPFCIFSEGTHRTMHSLLPLKKGIFRTAWAALDHNPGKPVYIVPVGLEYGDYTRFRSSCLMEFGEALDFGAFVDSHDNMPQGAIYKELAAELSSRISRLITYIPDNGDYESKWALVKLVCIGCGGSLENRRKENRKIAGIIEDNLADEDRSIDMRILLADVLGFEKARRDSRISIHSFGCSWFKTLLRPTLATGLLPLFIICAVFTMPVWGLSWLLCSKTEDIAFHNSLRTGLGLVLSPLTLVLWLVLGAFTLPLSGWSLVAILGVFAVAYIPMRSFFYDYLELKRIALSDLRLLFRGRKLRKERNKIIERFLAI